MKASNPAPARVHSPRRRTSTTSFYLVILSIYEHRHPIPRYIILPASSFTVPSRDNPLEPVNFLIPPSKLPNPRSETQFPTFGSPWTTAWDPPFSYSLFAKLASCIPRVNGLGKAYKLGHPRLLLITSHSPPLHRFGRRSRSHVPLADSITVPYV